MYVYSKHASTNIVFLKWTTSQLHGTRTWVWVLSSGVRARWIRATASLKYIRLCIVRDVCAVRAKKLYMKCFLYVFFFFVRGRENYKFLRGRPADIRSIVRKRRESSASFENGKRSRRTRRKTILLPKYRTPRKLFQHSPPKKKHQTKSLKSGIKLAWSRF